MDHITSLKSICRVCGQKIVLKPGYINAKSVMDYSGILFASYNIDVEYEDIYVYPKFLCSNCRRKLEKLKFYVDAVPQKAAVFLPHTDSCSLCKKVPKGQLRLVHLDKIFKSFNYVLYQGEMLSHKRLYLKQSTTNDFKTFCEKSILINLDDTWVLKILNRNLAEDHPVFKNMPKIISNDNIETVLSKIESLFVCTAIPDFKDVIDKRLGIVSRLTSINNEVIGTCEDETGIECRKDNFVKVRHKDCPLLSETDQCLSCNNYGNTLKKARSRLETSESQNISADSRVNYRYVSNEDIVTRMTNIQKERRSAMEKVAKLSRKLQIVFEKENVAVNSKTNDLLEEIMLRSDQPFDPETAQGLLWEQQKHLSKLKTSKGMRWHPLIIRWCLSIFFTSPAAYRQISNKSLGFLHLPHINTLKKYAKFTTAKAAFNIDIVSRLIEESKISEAEEYEKEVCICFDEMQIKSDLVYQKSSGKLIGFTAMGELNDEFQELNSYLESENDQFEVNRPVSNHVLVLLVRGIFTSLTYPLAYFGSSGATASQLYPCLIEATRILEGIGFKVRAFIADGATPNRKCFDIMVSTDFYKTINPFDHTRYIYFFSDVPHLLKTTRNCLENSGWNSKTRNMHFEKQDISWRHIVDLYEWDLGTTRAAFGLRRLVKYQEDYVKLTPRARMKVKPAAVVLSNSTASALTEQNRYDTKSTIKFCRMFDRVFDCLNVSHLYQHNKGKDDLRPYTSSEDSRFKFLTDDFLKGYLERWEEEANDTPRMTKEEKNKLLLSKQTRHGWRMTVTSFVELSKLLLEEYRDKKLFLLSEHFTQDPLEEHFSRQRRRGGCNENPTLQQFGDQEVSLNVMRSEMIRDLRGNVSKRQGKPLDVHDNRKLPVKRPYKTDKLI